MAGRPARHDDQVAALQALGHRIQVVEVHRDAGHRGAQRAAFDLLKGLGEDFGGGGEPLGGFLLADGKDLLLRLVQHLLHRQALIKAQLDHFIAGADQLAAQELVHHQPGHLLDRGGGRHPLHQLHQSVVAAHLLQGAGVGQPGAHGGEIRRLALAVQHQGGAEDLPVGVQIKRFRLQHIGHTPDCIGIQQDAAQHRFLRLQVLGRKRIGQSLEIGLIVAAALAKTTASPIVVLWQGDAHHGGRA